jgi:hypothetical protein
VKTTSRFYLLAAIVIGLGAGCASSPVSRIDANRERYESWPLEVREAILAGEARKGMTREQVEVALGKPSEVVSRASNDADEVWVYRRGGGVGSGLLNNTGLSVGTSIGGVGIGTGTSLGGGRRSVTEEEEVVFLNGVVVRSGATR